MRDANDGLARSQVVQEVLRVEPNTGVVERHRAVWRAYGAKDVRQLEWRGEDA